MKSLLVAALVLAVAIPAFAGDNPGVHMYVDFTDGGYVHRTDPAMYTAFDAFFMVGNFAGFTTISFMVGNTPGMSTPVAYDNLLPGNLAIGAYETGVTLAATECMIDAPLAVAVGHYFYLGVPGDIEILDHPEFPLWVVDCNDLVDYYCVLIHGGVCKEPLEGDPGCPVENSSWSNIKAMYR